MDNIQEIIKRYYKGETSLGEERLLKKEYREGRLPAEPLLDWQAGRRQLPEELAERFRQRFRTYRRRRMRRIAAVVGSMAASLVLIIALKGTFPGFSSGDALLNDSVKRERLENALRTIGQVLEEKNTPKEKILYEDRRLIIAVE